MNVYTTDKIRNVVMKLKGIDGGPHKRWSMWFNSIQRAKPYQPLTYEQQDLSLTGWY